MLSLPHLVVVFVVALVIFGPEKLPELARTLGKLTAEFRKATGDLRASFEEQMRQLERDAAEIERKRRELTVKQAAIDKVAPEEKGGPAPQFTVAPEITEGAPTSEAHPGDSEKVPYGLPDDVSANPRVAPPTPAAVPHETQIQPRAENVSSGNAHRS
jgi:TatA/E family protein of Tat protein translocase